MSNGKLIVIEGLDSAGKSSQIKLIKSYLNDNKLTCINYHFPMYGHNQFSEIISKFLSGHLGKISDVDPLFIATMYAMDRYKFLSELNNALQTYDVVLLDRYVYSNIAYQCAKVNDNEINTLKDWILEFEFNFLKLPFADLTIFLNVPIEVIQKRLSSKRQGLDRDYLNGNDDIHEADIELQKRVHKLYLNLIEGIINSVIINCATQVGSDENKHFYEFDANSIFNNYKKYLDIVLSQTHLK